MTVELEKDTFARSVEFGTGQWGDSTKVGWITSSGEASLHPYTDTLSGEEVCPINVLLLDSEQGQFLYAKYMSFIMIITPDGQGGFESTTAWQCAMCGTTDDGELPYFHNTLKKREE